MTLDDVRAATGFEVLAPEGDVPVTERPDPDYLRILREVVDPTSQRLREFA